jgi:hypothetical protein
MEVVDDAAGQADQLVFPLKLDAARRANEAAAGIWRAHEHAGKTLLKSLGFPDGAGHPNLD